MKASSVQAGERGTVVCLGYFDGVHVGHQALLRAGREMADRLGLPLLAHTFDRAPGNKGPALTDLAVRERLLLRFGADEVAVSPFDDAMRQMSGEAFIRDIVIGKLRARHIVCGDDHRFGYLGKCGVEELRALCEENRVGLTVIRAVTLDGVRASSTAIRQALERGDTAQAEKMLGYKVSEASLHAMEHTG